MKRIILSLICSLLLVQYAYCNGTRANEIDNLYYTCKIWGFLKYYHPTVRAGVYDWDQVLFKLLDKIQFVKTTKERNIIFEQLIDSLGAFEQDKPHFVLNDTVRHQQPDFEWLSDKQSFGDRLSQKLLQVKNAKRVFDNYYIQYYPEQNSAPLYYNEKQYIDADFSDIRYSILGLFRIWNAIEYFCPYKYLMDSDWDELLISSIPCFLECKNIDNYYNQMALLVAKTDDAHCCLYDSNDNNGKYLQFKKNNGLSEIQKIPVSLTYLNRQFVVDNYYNLEKKCELKPGDIILTVDDKDIYEIAKERYLYTAKSDPNNYDSYTCNYLLTSKKDSVLVKLIRSDSLQSVYAKTCLPKYDNLDTVDYKQITDDIGYVNMLFSSNELFLSQENQIFKNKGLIFDLRSYPRNYNFALPNYIYPKSTAFAMTDGANLYQPGYFTFSDHGCISGYTNNNYFKGVIVVLVGGYTMSQSEHFAMMLREAPRAMVIGNKTAGANGNVTAVPLPGGIFFRYSGLGIYWSDGSQLQRLGVRLDEEVKLTIKGLREGRDEVMERAIEIINNQK